MLTFTEQDKDTAVVKFYGAIGDWYQNAEAFTSIFDPAGAKYKNILIRVHCYGGSVLEGNVIANSIQNAKAYVTVKIEGVSASMFGIIMQYADKIIIADNGFVMVHCPSGSTSGNAKDHASTAKLLTKMEANFIKTIIRTTEKPESEVKALFDGSDHWFDAEEALAFGLVHEIAPAVVKNIRQLEKPDPSTEIVSIFNRYQALLQDDEQIFTKTTDMSVKKLLITALALTGVTEASGDQDFANAVAAKLQTTTPPAPANPATDAKASAETVLASIEKFTGKAFEASARTTLLGIGEKAGLEAMQGAMALMAPATEPATQPAAATIPQVVSMIGGATATGATPGRETWAFADWQKNAPEDLAAMAEKDYNKFNALYKAEFKTDAPK